MESQHRVSMTVQLLAPHSILIHCMVQRKALVTKEVLRRNIYDAAAR